MAFVSLVSGMLGSEAASDASNAQYEATKYAMDKYMEMFNISRQDQLPFIQAEQKRLPEIEEAFKKYAAEIEKGPGQFETSDYYKSLTASIDQMTKAAARQGAASGVGGGALQKSLLRELVPLQDQARQGWLTEWYNKKLNPLGTLGMVGQTPYQSTVQTMGLEAIQTGKRLGEAAMAGGQALASGYLGRAAAIQSAISPLSGPLTKVIGSIGSALGII